MATEAIQDYWGIVDMGRHPPRRSHSIRNGIRFSITNLAPPTTRILPTVFQERAAISLYDAQFPPGVSTKQSIPADTIAFVLASLSRFRATCNDFGVPTSQVRVLATAATRDAINSTEFRDAIHTATGWTVEMLSKEEEGRIGAMGVASSFERVRGLVMDLGGGSTQITWMVAEDGEVETAKTAVSLPYGAAALTKRLEAAHIDNSVEALRLEISTAYRDAYESLAVPEALAHTDGGLSLYLSGGGFRGWGYLLLSRHHINPYPMPIINGFKVDMEEFQDVSAVAMEAESKENVFRVSARRAKQVPAVAFLVGVIRDTIPKIKEVRFCQGGVREGALYASLLPKTRALPPLATATAPYAPPSTIQLLSLLISCLPYPYPIDFTIDVLASATNLLYYHSPIPKEGQASAGLNSTITGVLASAHGVSHENRALLALILCARWGLSVADPSLLHRLQNLVGDELAWWSRYIGQAAALIGAVYPAGRLNPKTPRLLLEAEMKEGKKGGPVIKLKVRTKDEGASPVLRSIGDLEGPGKKKGWVHGWGIKVDVIHKRDL